jgi:hypothetical protein
MDSSNTSDTKVQKLKQLDEKSQKIPVSKKSGFNEENLPDFSPDVQIKSNGISNQN